MCGIGGYVGSQAPEADEAALLQALAHRGPDHQARARLRAGEVPVVLCFARLAILDLSPLGHQPMATEDGALTLIYNGEAYNCRELRQRLHARGHRFRSGADTEVVLRGYREWGPGVLSRLRGMFALALWDAGAQELFLARDRIGKKPLYYGYDGRRFFFASELRALLAAGLCGRRLDPRGLHGYLALGSVPQPQTLLRDVQQLLPGHELRVRVEGGRVLPPQERCYFALPVPGSRFVEEDATGGVPLVPTVAAAGAAGAVAPVLQEAVGQRLLADVPVGLLLSGGVDSTAVALLCRRADPAGPLHSFTLTYGEALAESEGAEARQQARLLHLIHHEGLESAATLLAQVPAYMDAVDQPSVDGLNTYLVSRQVRQAGLKVALSGLGGDEIFLGYGLHRPFVAALRLARLLGPLPRAARSLSTSGSLGSLRRGKQAALLEATARPAGERALAVYAALRALWPAPQLRGLLEPDLPVAGLDAAAHVRCALSPAQRAAAPAEALLAYLEVQNYLCNTLLRDADVMSMVHGVELRVPLCDHRLVALLLALRGGTRRGRRTKPLLLDACRSPVLDRVAARPKRGFVLPLREWLAGPQLGDAVAPVLHDPTALRAAGLVPAQVATWWRDYQEGRAPDATWRLWSLYTLLRWLSLHRVGL